MLYFTYAAPWYHDLHMFETPKSLLAGSGEGPEESPSPLPFLASPAATPKTGAFPCGAANGREGKGAAFPCASAAVLPQTDACACRAADGTPEQAAARALCRAVWASRPAARTADPAALRPGGPPGSVGFPTTEGQKDEGEDYGHPHFTDRFDMLLLEGLLDQTAEPAECAAVLANAAAW